MTTTSITGLIGSETSACKRHAFDRQAKARALGHDAGMARHHDAELAAGDGPLGRVDPGNAPVFPPHTRHLGLLDDVHPHVRTGPRIAPGDRVMARGAAARLPQRAQNRVARPVEVDDRAQFLDPAGADEFGRHPLQRIGMGGALVAADLVFRLGQHHHAAGLNMML
jgi:hypothetical protein